MKRIFYSGEVILTADRIADAVLEYAAALARHQLAESVVIPAITSSGERMEVELVIGPASQLVAETAEDGFGELDDSVAVQLEAKTAQLSPHRPQLDDYESATEIFDDFELPRDPNGSAENRPHRTPD